MPHAVVWDTNVYRSLTHEEFDSIIGLERNRKIEPWADPWVIMELLVHLADTDDPSFSSCRLALRRVYLRCADGQRIGRGGILSDCESQITQMITGRALVGHAETTIQLGNYCHLVGETPLHQPLPFEAGDLRWIADHVSTMEDWFTKHSRELRELVEKRLAEIEDKGERRLTRAAAMQELGKSGQIRTVIADALVRGAFRDVGLAAPEPLDPRFVELVGRTLAVGLEFHVQVLRKVVYDNANLDAVRTRNLLWDERIAYCVGQEVGDAPIWFVTNDPAFSEAARAASYTNRVRSLDEYWGWLRKKPRGLSRKRRRRPV